MTVAVSCNLSEGVVLAVDSAVTLSTPDGGVAKVYENADKLFQLGNRPIGMAIYGLGAMGQRSIGSFIREFELVAPAAVLGDIPGATLEGVVEAIREYLWGAYEREVIPLLEGSLGKPWDQFSDDEKPILGVVVGGFSGREYLSEVWEVVLPRHTDPGSATQLRAKGSFGTNWFAMYEPIRRYIKGVDGGVLSGVIDYMLKRSRRPRPLRPEEVQELQDLCNRAEYSIPYGAMPMGEGVAHARFLVELVINHHRYASGAPIVGGRARVGRVTYRHGAFEILD